MIRDFEAGKDLIDLSQIDASVDLPGHQAFDFIGSTAFSDTAGELRFRAGRLSGDVDGDGRKDFEISITRDSGLGEADLLL